MNVTQQSTPQRLFAGTDNVHFSAHRSQLCGRSPRKTAICEELSEFGNRAQRDALLSLTICSRMASRVNATRNLACSSSNCMTTLRRKVWQDLDNARSRCWDPQRTHVYRYTQRSAVDTIRPQYPMGLSMYTTAVRKSEMRLHLARVRSH
jgi:hypothetical protein